MTPEDKDLAENISPEKPIYCGEIAVYAPLQVGDKPFHFDAIRIRFIAALQKYQGDLEKACNAVGKTLDWGKEFVSSRKYRQFMRKSLALAGAKQGNLANEWWEMGIAGMRGYRELYIGKCELCHEETRLSSMEYAMLQDDNMVAKPTCEICLQPITLTRETEPYKPTREMVQHWDGIGARVVPKVERVQHEFSDEKYSFVPDNTDDVK